MAIIKKYQAEVIAVEKPFENLYTLTLKPVNNVFRYAPGQFLHLAVDEYDPSAAWPESRCFSMQSPPSDPCIRITYAVKGSYTKRMAREITVGNIVTLKLPYGDLFSQEHSKTDTVFIAGGTGITPFLSLFNHSTFADYKNPVLYVGFRNPDFNLYEKELTLAKELNGEFRVYYFYENETGVIDIAGILNTNGCDKTYFISGPPQMIKAFKNYLLSNNVMPDNIKTDDWE